MKKSILSNQMSRSPIQRQSFLSRQSSGGSGKKTLFFSLNLTTLIDAFCILVIFLLSNMNGQLKQIQLSQKMTLPSARQGGLINEGVIVRVENEQYFVNDKKVSTEKLLEVLYDLKKTETTSSLVIQADKNSNYDKISLLLRAGGQVGFEKYLFAVLPGT